MRLESFNQFNAQPQALVLENLLVLNDEKCMAKYSLNEFKNFFKRALLLESVNQEDNIMLEKAHAYYEMSMLSEAKREWFEKESSPVYLDAEDHMILINNNEAFIISKSTYTAINEDWGWGDITDAWDSYTNKVVSVAKSVSKDVIKTYNEVSDGAKKAWEWVKTAGSAAVKFLGEMTWVDWATLGLGVLSACMGILGTAIPGATIIAGVLLALTGGLHLYEGYHKYHEATDKLKSLKEGDLTKSVAGINESLPDIAMGSIFTILGLHDISSGLTQALADPTAGAQSLAIKGSAIAGGKKSIASMAHKLEHTIGGGWAGKAMKNLGKNKAMQTLAEKAAGYTGLQLAGILGHGILVSCLGWMYKGCLNGGSSIMKGISWVLDIPQKIIEGIDKLRKNATGAIGTIIANGLSSLVQPMAKSAAKAINKYLKPAVNSAKAWFDRQIIIYDVCSKAIREEKTGTHESILIEEEDDSIPGIESTEVSKDEVKLINNKSPIKATPEDEKLLKKMPEDEIKNKIEDETGPGYDYKELAKEGTSESKNNFLKHLKLYENFSN